MNCSTCQHLLWGIRGRTCPECGTPFTVSINKEVMKSSYWFGTSAFLFMPIPAVGDVISTLYWYVLANYFLRVSTGRWNAAFICVTLVVPAIVTARRAWMIF